MPEPPPIPIPERHEFAGEPAKAKSDQAKSDQAKSDQAKSDQAKSDQAKSELAKSELAKAELAKSETAKSAPSRSEPFRSPPVKAIAQRPPPPPPLPQQPRPSAEDTQSVLARLRQLTPAPTLPADTPPAPAQEIRPRAPSPSLPRLAAARTALINGQIEDARRLLQEAQLQLVFRPVDAPGDEPQAAGKGASDVAHALDALSANDVALSRRYVDVAVADISGAAVSPQMQETERRASGYAPAYPPR
ncbi:MAG TPA: hypothetical protein VHU42_00360 [Rhodopila sp.]|nr:hypothetical protein [Rhodopila sp.]